MPTHEFSRQRTSDTNTQTKISRYLQLVSSLFNLRTAPIVIWNNFQPKLYKIIKPNQEAVMKRFLQPYFLNKSGICIGGELKWQFQEYLETAFKTINVDLTTSNNKQKIDYTTDASNLYFADSNEYDFVCSSHLLEHLMNPIKAIEEWKRVIKPQGIIYCAVPDKRFTFDHKRKRTTMQHILKDFYSDVSPRDETHIQEALFGIDYKLAGMNKRQHKKWVEDYVDASKKTGAPIYQPHVHVYTKEDVIALFKISKMNIVFSSLLGTTVHIVAKKR
jgi:predicted SAM-dependent methyltransferase